MSADKPIHFSRHATQQMIERGVSRHDVERTVRGGRRVAAKQGRQGYRRDFPFAAAWGGRHYQTKRVLVIVAEDEQQN